MGRSSYAQAAKNREKILESANDLFRARGVDNVSVAEVMAATGMTTGGFYKHFESKDALVRETFDLSFQKALAAWRKASAGRQAAEMVNHYFQKKPPERACPLIAYAPHVRLEASDEQTVEAYRRGAEGLLAQFLDRLPASDRRTQVLFAAMVGANLLAEATGDAQWARSLKDAIRDEAAMLTREAESAAP
jgi:TetR/AcrR family transcriptional repressor of nem operon